MHDPRGASSQAELARARALVFAVLSVGPLLYSFACRSERRLLVELGPLSNRALIGATLVGVLLQAITIYAPPLHGFFKTTWLDLGDVGLVLLASTLPFVYAEGRKLVLRAARR